MSVSGDSVEVCQQQMTGPAVLYQLWISRHIQVGDPRVRLPFLDADQEQYCHVA